MKTRSLSHALGVALVGVFVLAAASIAAGQTTPGVSDKEIVIGSCSALEGPSHTLGLQTVAGAKAYFSMVNDEGGVHGRKLRLVASDDSYDPAKTQI
jgi:branched-chain amino acid transport system substrate-binding protein